MIIPYLRNIIDNHKDMWKIQLAIEISFVSYVKDFNKDSNEGFNEDSYKTYTIHIHSENSSIFIGYETDNIIKELFDSLLKEYQESLKTKMKRSDLVFDSVDALYCKLHKRSLNRRSSYIDSPEWRKSKIAKINPKNKRDDKCFPYAIAVALNHQQINNDPE